MDISEQRPLTLPQVAAAAEVEYATLHSWLKRGLLVASLQTSTGSGMPNLARVLADLRRAGVDFESLEKASRELHKRRETLSGEEILAVNGRVDLFEADQPIEDLLQEREPAVAYRLSWAREAVESIVET